MNLGMPIGLSNCGENPEQGVINRSNAAVSKLRLRVY